MTANGHSTPELKAETEATIQAKLDSSFAGDMKAMYRDETFADVMLFCGKVEIPCHSVVLAHRSGNFFKLAFFNTGYRSFTAESL